MEAIVTAKQKERQAEAERIRRETAAKHDEELQLAAEEHRALHEGNKARKVPLADLCRCHKHHQINGWFSTAIG